MKTNLFSSAIFIVLLQMSLGWLNPVQGQSVTQSLVPDGDISNTGWLPTPMYTRLSSIDNVSINQNANQQAGQVSMQDPVDAGTYTAVALTIVAKSTANQPHPLGFNIVVSGNSNIAQSITVQSQTYNTYTLSWSGLNFTQAQMNSLQVYFYSNWDDNILIDYVGANLTYTPSTPACTAPDLTLPSPITANNDAGLCGASVNFTASATGTPEPAVTYEINENTATSPYFFPTGTTTVYVTASNTCGSETGSFTVTVTDNQNPAITAPAGITAYTNTACTATGVNLGSPVTDDNCTVASVTHDAPSAFSLGNTTVTWTVTDGSGNTATAIQTVTIIDNLPPVALAKNVTVTLANGSASVLPGDVDNGSYDNCGIASLSLSKTSFVCSDIGNVPVTLTVVDNSGNSSSCSAVVTVAGYIPICSITAVPANGTYTGGVPTTLYLGYGSQSVTLASSVSGGSGFTYSWSGPAGLSSTTSASPVFTPASEGRHTFTLTATNSNGCSCTSSITICVLDIRVPGSNGNKVYLCHLPNGNPGNAQTLSISANAIPGHIPGHPGDHLGSCNQSCDNIGFKTGETGDIIATAGVSFETVLYPNPFTDEITLTIESEDATPATIMVYDLSSRLVSRRDGVLPNSTAKFGNELQTGIYMVVITQGTQSQRMKVVKSK